MIEELTEKLETIEILRLLASEYKQAHAKCLCPITRMRIGWDWHKAVLLKKARQKEALALADQAVSKEELTQFLQSQSINLYIP